MEGIAAPVGIDIGCGLDIGVAHKFLCYIEGNSGPLEICAERMPQAVGDQIRSHNRIDNLIAVNGGTHVDVQVPPKSCPQSAQAVFVLEVSGLSGKDRGEGFSFGRPEPPDKIGMNRNVPDSGIRLWPLDGS